MSDIDQVKFDGVVLYTDGSSRPNPGNGGCGIHGYLFTYEDSKKGTGLPDHIVTNRGYVKKTVMAEGSDLVKDHTPVTPVTYIDGFSSFLTPITNNVAELVAATIGIERVISLNPKEIVILTDSQYTINCATKWIAKWLELGWKKPSGEDAANKNELIALHSVIEKCKELNIELKFEWVEGHVGILGNVLADALAAVGSSYSRFSTYVRKFDFSPAEGYWKYEASKHPFLNQSFLYFNTIAESIKPGTYFLGNQGKEEEMVGKKVPDCCFSYVTLNEPDPVLEEIRNFQVEVAGGFDSIVFARLEYIFNAKNHKLLANHGRRALYQPSLNRFDLVGSDMEPVTRELKPPKIASRSIDMLNMIADVLINYPTEGTDSPYLLTDISDVLYDRTTTVKKGKEPVEEVVLKKDYVVGFSALPVTVNYRRDHEVAKENIILSLGIDLPERNTLKRLEKLNPKVEVITWLESERAFRYAVVIHVTDGKGIWCGCYSNLKLVK